MTGPRGGTAYERLTDALRDHGCRGQYGDKQTTVTCPAHEDRSPSLSVTRIEGQVLVHCHAGCHIDDVLAVINWSTRDLFDEPRGARYDYRDINGHVTRTVTRTPDKRFHQSGQTKGPSTLYRLPEVVAAVAAGTTVYVVEGEKDVHALESVGAVATTAPMGATNWHKVDATPLTGAHIIVIPDRDEAGKKWAEQVNQSLTGITASLAFRLAREGKDAADHLAAGHDLSGLVPVEIDEPTPEPTAADLWLADLGPYLDGTYVPPTPTLGVTREDGKHVLYPGRWHTMIGTTGVGKSWFAAQCAFDEIHAGRTVLYVHFEESLPAGTVDRMHREMGLAADTIRKQFLYVDRTKGKITGPELALLVEETKPSLVILDGINAVCGQYGWDVEKTTGVGAYRSTLVEPCTSQGAAVLSLGHPVKARDRQNERHGFGSSAWLDEVDGVGFRVVGSKTAPIRRGAVGYANVSTVKDRYGQVEEGGDLSDVSEGWFDIGSLRVDSDTAANPPVRVRLLQPGGTAPSRDIIDVLADEVVAYLAEHDGGRFASRKALGVSLRAAGTTLREASLPIALERLKLKGLIEWPDVVSERKPRPGWLTAEGRACSHDRFM